MKRIIFFFAVLLPVILLIGSTPVFATSISVSVEGNRGVVVVSATANFDTESGGSIAGAAGVGSFMSISGTVSKKLDTTNYADGVAIPLMVSVLSSDTGTRASETIYIVPDNKPEVKVRTNSWRGNTNVEVEYSFPSVLGNKTGYVKMLLPTGATRIISSIPLTEVAEGEDNQGTASTIIETLGSTLYPDGTHLVQVDSGIGSIKYENYQFQDIIINNIPKVTSFTPVVWASEFPLKVGYNFPSTQSNYSASIIVKMDNTTLRVYPPISIQGNGEITGTVTTNIDTLTDPERFSEGAHNITVDVKLATLLTYENVYETSITIDNILDHQPKDPSAEKPRLATETVGHPIDVSNGNVFTTETDLSIPAQGISLELKRSYNSNNDYVGVFGYGWRSTYDVALSEEEGGVKEINADGVYTYYTPNGDGSYSSSAGKHSSLVKNTDGSFTITRKHGYIYEFNADGKLIEIRDRNNNNLSLSYDANNVLTSITHSNGKSITLIPDANGRISEAHDPAGRITQYQYDSDGNLVTVIDPLSEEMNYGYDNAHNMTVEINKKGTPIYWEYSSEDKATSSWQAGDMNRVNLDFVDELSTTVTNSRGYQTTYTFNEYVINIYTSFTQKYQDIVYPDTFYTEFQGGIQYERKVIERISNQTL